MEQQRLRRRYALLDMLRGLTICSMVAYHTVWDLVYLFRVPCPWYPSEGTALWQQTICWSFLLLSGFCWPLGRRHLRQGLLVSACGALITAVTLVFNPAQKVVFGVLTLLGAATLLLIPLDKILRRVPPAAGIAASLAVFAFCHNLSKGYLGLGTWQAVILPKVLYQGYFATFLGFLAPGFYSSDYFPILPWAALVFCGYFAAQLALRRTGGLPPVFRRGWAPLCFLGRHSLLIYVLHQPALYGLLWCLWHF
ncbi:MAG: DUF1624 domain-containing protein [Faecalibacterium sp.]|jgi:uncharacterized membrane protein|nr:DUF1624 domain-containing protein [Faecalibacterium sp.]